MTLGLIFVVSRRPLVALSQRLRRNPQPTGNRLAIYVAKFGEDEASAKLRRAVIRSIQRELGSAVEVLPANTFLAPTPGVSEDVAGQAATDQGRKLLKRTHGDLLIWGELLTLHGQGSAVALYFVSAETSHSRVEPFGFTPTVLLDADFGVEMGVALAAVVATMALPAIENRGQFVASMLERVATRLRPLLRQLSSFRPDHRGQVLVSFAVIQSTIGEQAGRSKPLEEAIEAYRAALKEYTRARVPLKWAETQHNLGTVLWTLGERESGTARLEEAVNAYHAALEELTRARFPWTGPRSRTISPRRSGALVIARAAPLG